MPAFSDPAHPEQNGRHERMHRDLKAACAAPASYDLRAQQRSLNSYGFTFGDHFAILNIVKTLTISRI